MSARKRRITILTLAHSNSFYGGAEYQIDCLIKALVASQRYDIQVIATFVHMVGEPQGYQLVHIGKRNPAPKLGYLVHAMQIGAALRDFEPDVIYQRVACGYTGIAAYYAKRSGAQMVWHVAHDSDVIRGGTMLGRNPVRAFLEKRSIEYGIRHASNIVVQTGSQARLLQQNYGRTADALIPNFHPQPPEALDKTGPVTVVWIANLKPWKQPEIFVRLASALRDIEGVRFIMVGAPPGGSGDQAWNEELLGSIRSTANLSYAGRKTQSEVNELLAKSHVFVNTSVQEGFPNTFIQAWMREVPVVSLQVDPDNVLQDGNVGVFANSSEAHLAASVRRLISEPDYRANMGRRAREHAMAKHSIRNAATAIEILDSGAAASSTNRPRWQ